MMKKYKLGELVEVSRGASLSGNYYATSGNYIRLTCGNFDYRNNCFKENYSKDNLFYTGDFKDDFLLEKGDLITPLTEQAIGLLGSTAWIPKSGKYIQSQDIAKITCKEELLNKKFAYYLISSNMVKQQLSAAAQQTKIRHTSPDKIRDCTVWIPSLSEQTQIGQLLFDIDCKMEINRSINHNLEAMAKQLYDYWFVQFDFPDENGKPYKSSGGKMVWNERLKREIPEGWNDGILSDVSEIKSGFPFKSEKYTTNGQYGIITIKNVQDHRLELFPMDKIDSKPSKLPSYCDLKVGNCLISLTGNVGRICRVYKGNLLLNQRVGVIVTNNNSPEWVYQLFDDKSIYKQVQSLSNGAAQANVSPIDIGKIQMVIPPKDILIHFEKRINGVYSTFIRNEREVLELTKLRNELLPLLMNGQVSVNYDLSHD